MRHVVPWVAIAAVSLASPAVAQTGTVAGGQAAGKARPSRHATGHVGDRRRPAKTNHGRPAPASNGTTETQTGATNSGMTGATTPQ